MNTRFGSTRSSLCILALLLAMAEGCLAAAGAVEPAPRRPNFLLYITDDQSWAHTSFAGYKGLKTPNFDTLASQGAYFEHGYASAPTCTASRSAVLAGQHFWRLGPAALLWGEYQPSLVNYQKLLESAGYLTGYTGKGWGPGKPGDNPAGLGYNQAHFASVPPGISDIDYAENFRLFLAQRKPGQPFSFWLSPTEPHRPYGNGWGMRHGINAATLALPPFLPDNPDVRMDVADYLFEIQWADQQLGKVIEYLRQAGELENTVIVLTSDNGMPFARAKSNNYEYGTHVPFAIYWAQGKAHHVRLTDFVSLADLAPTFLDMAGIRPPAVMTGKSLRNLLANGRQSGQFDPQNQYAFSGFERHIGKARPGKQCYPSRAIHSEHWLYISNLAPDRWPAGNPTGFEDIDNGSPSKLVILNDPEYAQYLSWATAKRPAEELYDLKNDPGQLHNLAGQPEYAATQKELAQRLQAEMKTTADPHTLGKGAVFDTYTDYSDTKEPRH